jgi:hypothetical protein
LSEHYHFLRPEVTECSNGKKLSGRAEQTTILYKKGRFEVEKFSIVKDRTVSQGLRR